MNSVQGELSLTGRGINMGRNRAITTVLLLLISAVIFFENGIEGDPEASCPTRGDTVLEMDMNISEASEASFIGEEPGDYADKVTSAGDVNGDGYDDLLIGSSMNSDGGYRSGQTYLIFGRAGGWMKDADLSSADASFFGENAEDNSGSGVSGVGDVNGDGYDDILIGAFHNNEGGDNAGQSYLIFGKPSGWSMDTSLSSADASFIGEESGDYSGSCLSGAGDVNGDGYDDILIGVDSNDEYGSYTGQTYLIFGKPTGWSKDTDLSSADASFVGEDGSDHCGYSVSGASDVNGDGYDDILITSIWDKVYLIFGKPTGWSMDTPMSNANADASFMGEDSQDYCGASVSGAGDVNGDGYDDILIGAPYNDDGGENTGQAYLVFGKATGWTFDTDLSAVDASFQGENVNDNSSIPVSGAGDVNGDGYDDILIGAYGNDEGGDLAGQTYLILGKSFGWGMDTNLSNADASFIGEESGDCSGSRLSGAGDVNGDGNHDIIIGASGNDQGGENSGKTYLITGFGGSEPEEVYSVEIYSDPGYSVPMDVADIGDTVYIELLGLDGNTTHQDVAIVNISFSLGSGLVGTAPAFETGENTGIYRAIFTVPLTAYYLETLNFSSRKDPTKSDTLFIDKPNRPAQVNSLRVCWDEGCTQTITHAEKNDRIFIEIAGVDADPTSPNFAFVNISSDKLLPEPSIHLLLETGTNTGTYRGTYRVPLEFGKVENLTITTVRNEALTTEIRIETLVLIGPSTDTTTANEDREYRVKYRNMGSAQVTWTFDTNASWLSFNQMSRDLYGTPLNSDVGIYSVEINITDGKGHYDQHQFTLKVLNADPLIIGTPPLVVNEDEEYYFDFDSSDDNQGDIKWELIINQTWLSIDEVTGVLNGTPTNDNVGITKLSIRVDDGNGGMGWLAYQIEVINTNDPPSIITEDITEVYQDDPYKRDYEVADVDVGDSHLWSLETNATWLEIDEETGELSGTPTNDDVGMYYVKVTVTDSDNAKDNNDFELEVINVNDPPKWTYIPEDTDVDYRDVFRFDVDAEDVDVGTTLVYSLSTEPKCDMEIDPETGEIEWIAHVDAFDDPPYRLQVTVGVTDGKANLTHTFRLEIMPLQPPKSSLTGPDDGIKLSHKDAWLTWINIDEWKEPVTYDLYLSEQEPMVESLRAECCVLAGTNVTSYNVSSLDMGKTYYWTVIPHDGCSRGSCLQGVQSFFMNTPPEIPTVPLQKATSGSQYELALAGTDDDDIDRMELEYFLRGAPLGMEVDSVTGKIKWTPGSDQVGKHTFTAVLSDGTDETEREIEIVVGEGEEGAGSLLIIILAIVVIAIIGIVVAVIFLRKKQKKMIEDDEAEKEGTEFQEGDLTADEQKLRQQMEELKQLTGVSLSVEEAHEHDRDHKETTYEDLYGTPAPEKMDEGTASTEETKEFIGEQIKELEKMDRNAGITPNIGKPEDSEGAQPTTNTENATQEG